MIIFLVEVASELAVWFSRIKCWGFRRIEWVKDCRNRRQDDADGLRLKEKIY